MMEKLTHYIALLFAVTLISCNGGSNDGGNANDGAVSSEDNSASQTDPTSPTSSPASNSGNDSSSQSSNNQLSIDLNLRKSINFDGSGQSISIEHNPMFDVWSDNKDYSWSINLVKDSSNGAEFLPLIARGSSVYSIKATTRMK